MRLDQLHPHGKKRGTASPQRESAALDAPCTLITGDALQTTKGLLSIELSFPLEEHDDSPKGPRIATCSEPFCFLLLAEAVLEQTSLAPELYDPFIKNEVGGLQRVGEGESSQGPAPRQGNVQLSVSKGALAKVQPDAIKSQALRLVDCQRPGKLKRNLGEGASDFSRNLVQPPIPSPANFFPRLRTDKNRLPIVLHDIDARFGRESNHGSKGSVDPVRSVPDKHDPCSQLQ